MTALNNTTTAEKIRLFRRFFDGLPNVYGTYDPVTGRVHQVKRPVTDQIVVRHLQGRQPYGAYLLVQDRTRAVVVDFFFCADGTGYDGWGKSLKHGPEST